MPRPPLDLVREELSHNPREYEYIDLGDTAGWSETEKQDVVAELLSAANGGDPRAVSALWGLMPREWLRSTFESLVVSAPALVRVEAGNELVKLTRSQLEKGLESAFDQLDDSGLRRAFDLLLAVGDDSLLWRMLRETQREALRTAVVDRLWSHSHLQIYPQVWWSGLGLLRTELLVPLPSFRAARLDEFEQLAKSGLISDKYPPEQGTLPPALVAAMRDVEGAPGPIADPPLSDDQKCALTAYAAKWALSQFSPRGVAYVAHLSGSAHRDLFEWASAQPNPALAQAGRDALSGA